MRAREYYRTQGVNFMTPEVVEYIDANGYMIELSKGEGFDHEPIYGVTVATADGVRLYDESQMFHSESEARGYVEGLTA